MNVPREPYAARLTIDVPEERDRLSVGLRVFFVIPILIVLGALGGGVWSVGADTGTMVAAGSGGVLFIPVLLMIVFRQKYPGWWFDWNLAFTRFATRVGAYFALLTDQYPSTDEEQGVHLEIDRPDVERDLNRWLPLVKWLLAIPHYIVLFFLGIAAVVVVIIMWFVVVFTGRAPEGMTRFVQGVFRWSLRVQAYAILLVTDRYPPFSLDEGS